MDTLALAKKEYSNADSTGKAMLERIFSLKSFQSITERVTTFEQACAEVGEDPNDPKFSTGPIDECAYRKLKVIYKAMNEGVELSFANGNQPKWRIWWEYDTNTSGFRFDGSGYVSVTSYSAGGSRLCLVSEKLANHVGKYFAKEHNDFMKQFEP